VPPTAQTYKLAVTAHGEHIAKSPYTIVAKGGAAAAKSTVDTWSFTVRARDSVGEPVGEGDDEVTAELRLPSDPSFSKVCSVRDLGTGDYLVSVFLPQRGEFEVHVSLSGSALPGSPFKISN
jgi:hypothetical protein